MKTKRTKLFLLAGAFLGIQLFSLAGVFGVGEAQAATNGRIFYTGATISESGATFNPHLINPDGSNVRKLTENGTTNFLSPSR